MGALLWDKRNGVITNGAATFSAAAALLRGSAVIDIEWSSYYGTRCNMLIARGDTTQVVRSVGGNVAASVNNNGCWYIGLRTVGMAGRLALVNVNSGIPASVISDWRMNWANADERAYVLAFFEGVRKAYLGIGDTLGMVDVAAMAAQLDKDNERTTEEQTYGLDAVSEGSGTADLGFEVPRLRVPGG